MSGGALDYAEHKLRSLADEIRGRASSIFHIALADHIDKVAKAVHDTEWMLSGDTSFGSEIAAIQEVVGPTEMLETAVKQAEKAKADLEKVLEAASA